MLRSKGTLTAITRRRAAFAANKVAQIVALGLLYTLISVTQFSIFLANGEFSQSGSHLVRIVFQCFSSCLSFARHIPNMDMEEKLSGFISKQSNRQKIHLSATIVNFHLTFRELLLP